MAEIDDSILVEIQDFQNELSRKYKLKYIFLYGSYADGTNDEWSDIDIAVILDDSNSYSREIFSIGKEFDTRFDALGFSAYDFEHSLLPIIPEIKNKGLQIL